ncbi:macrophage mannose receptor 1-like [Pollicipes pollicipes]|uniref:macrophage mannose receptor 1-like n=1 Tax=Pollicipes pollicipes TaxID=41117 RepID=UPI001884D0C1|nr:macrophage mannose receptor 1-like [Pollicipes pollicipes]
MAVSLQRAHGWWIGVMMTAALIAGSPCPLDWAQRGAWCFQVNATRTMSWAGAGALCQERGGQLAVIGNRSRLLDVMDLLRANSATRWWIGLKEEPESLGQTAFFDNFGEDKLPVPRGRPASDECAYLSSLDGFWYWAPCDSAMHYVCQRAAQRVSVELVTPDRQRPTQAWFNAYALNIEDNLYALRVNAALDDDKGVFSEHLATATPIPPPRTPPPPPPPPTPAVTSPPAQETSSVAPTGTTPSLCQGRGWLMLDVACYQLMLDAKNWSLAREACAQQGGELASFRNLDVQQSFVARFGHISGSVWMGLRRRGAAGAMTWPDGTSPSYGSWEVGQPDTEGRPDGCGALALHTGKWSDQDCSAYKPFACKRSLDATTVLTTSTPPTTAPPSRCGAGGWWEYRGSCFLLVTDAPAVGWHAAQQRCRQRSAHLAVIETAAENDNIFHRATQSNLPVWIGLNKLTAEHHFTWVDGAVPVFTSWAHGQNLSADLASCARMGNEDGYWRAINCNSPQYFVCQRPLSGGVAPPPPAPPPPPAGSLCPEGWSPYDVDRCLMVFSQPRSWAEARRTCQNLAQDGDLVTINGSVQQAFVTLAMKDSVAGLWMGLTYVKQEVRFPTWTDESPVNFTHWAPGQPSNVCDGCPETCGLLDSGRSHSPGAWIDVDCTHAFGYICQRPVVPSTSQTVGGAPAAESAHCPPPHDNFLAVGDACVKVVRRPATWQEAASTCQQDNSSLAYVGDVFENAALVTLLYRDGGDQYWLGLTDTERYGSMQWTAPWPAEPTFSNWEPGRPAASARASCAALRPATGWWRHLSCARHQPYVCMRAPRRERTLSAAGRCPSRQWSASDRRCYRLQESVGHPLTWHEAKQACEVQGQQLAVISSENDFLAVLEAINGLTRAFTAWIGLQQMDNGTFSWVDGSSVMVDGWAHGEPSASLEACVEASRLLSGRWNDLRCSMYRPYVCMVELDGGDPAPPASSKFAPRRSAVGGSSLGVFGIVCLTLLLLTLLIGGGVWLVRRRRKVASRHRRLYSGDQAAHHDIENPVYDQDGELLAGRGSSLERSGQDGFDAAATARWQAFDEHQEENHL